MGEAASWIAFHGLDRAEIATRFDCIDTDAVADRKTDLALGQTPNGWLIVRSRRFDYPTPSRLTELSKQAELVACQVEEHVMVSAACGFRDGAQVWAVMHDPEKSVSSLMVEGAPPPEFETIRAELAADQEADGGEEADVDVFFEAAPKLLAALSGYRHDGDDPITFTKLQPIRRGLLQSLFGRS